MTEKEILVRLKLIQKVMPEGSWAELCESDVGAEAMAGKFAAMLDLVDDMLIFLISDIEKAIREEEECMARWRAEREQDDEQ